MIEGTVRPYERALTASSRRSYAGAMYVPRFNALDDADEIRALVEAVGSAQLVTVGPGRLPASRRCSR